MNYEYNSWDWYIFGGCCMVTVGKPYVEHIGWEFPWDHIDGQAIGPVGSAKTSQLVSPK